MANQITGKILYIYPTQQIMTKDGKPFQRRSLVLDTTRFDPYTGERGFENTPMLDFAGDQCQELDRFTPGQLVTVSFDVQGSRYRNADGKEQIFTRLRPYRIELRVLRAEQQAPQQQAPAYQAAPNMATSAPNMATSAPNMATSAPNVATQAASQAKQAYQPAQQPAQQQAQQGWAPPMVDANGNPIEGADHLPF